MPPVWPLKKKKKKKKESMKKKKKKKKRRREIQEKYNKEHNIIPKTIIKEIRELISNKIETKDTKKNKLTKKEKEDMIDRLKKEMNDAAKKLDFERATELRDIIFEMESE